MSVIQRLHSASIRCGFTLLNSWRPYGRCLAFLERTQWWPWQEIQELQWRKLRALIQHAWERVPFYRERFASLGIRPEDIGSVKDLALLPILTKEEIQEHREALIATAVRKERLIENHTGGSTGHPLTFYQDKNFEAWRRADVLRNYRWAGYRLGARWAFLWGSDYDARQHRGLWSRWVDRIVYNLRWINTFDLSAETLVLAAKQLARWKPEIIVAYVSSAVLLARLVREQGLEGIRPRSIQTSAEVLTPEERHLLEETFHCRVFDRYGCREVGNIAHECPSHQGLHVLAENNLVELVDDMGRAVPPGQVGRVIVTNLNNYAMPFIRYEVGDLAIAAQAPCSCGRGLPLWKQIVGRKSDVIISPCGKLLHGEFFTHLFYRLDGVRQFRVIQETRTDLRIQIVPGQGFDAQMAVDFLKNAILRHGDPAFQVYVELCEHLPPCASGKYRFTVSNVPLELASR